MALAKWIAASGDENEISRDQQVSQPRSQGLSSLPPLSIFSTTMEAEKRDPGNEVAG